ncbi:ATP-dependent RNA helicase [Actinidia chinensis var. chinensis]|uniref:RBR-type E3 ubiquitin transferase n=1 Tax=Actinidia chinensis var. chinensis TaxID=1590841 RepID=A0A2R6R359_ACTCC|nr:ATP-dependent RNA helicase [Actinidia chinensis var. chinensis]
MFSGLVPGLNSAYSPEYEHSGEIPASLITLIDLFPHGVAFFVLCSRVVIAIALIVWSTYSEASTDKEGDRGCDSPESDAASSSACLTYLVNDDGVDIVHESDAKYAEELQVQEALFASLLSSQMADTAKPYYIQNSPKLNSEQSRSFCGICLEEKESWQMFTSESCSHSFCYDCTSKHIEAKIQDNTKVILCPGVDCKSPLDFDSCRQIIPNDVLVRWDESLCKSLIPDSQTVYCPFRDCLALLVNDSGEVIVKIKCPSCHRSICARCHVPWHTEFSCKEFQRLNAKKRGKEEILVVELAKKKSWRKCPSCKMYVEKTDGCLHVICRCGNGFCYQCGSKWSKCSSGCRQRREG